MRAVDAALSRRSQISVTVIALAGLAAHHLFPTYRPDNFTLAMIILAILPWMAGIIKSIEIANLFKVELGEIRKDVSEALGAAQSADQKADFAIAGAIQQENIQQENIRSESIDTNQLFRLAEQYDRIREVRESSDERTTAMTGVVNQMITEARIIGTFDVQAALNSASGGVRLAGFAYLYANPDVEKLSHLTAAVTRVETKPFGQYWGLQAIRRVIEASARDRISRDVAHQISDFQKRVPRGTDRYYEARRILELLNAG